MVKISVFLDDETHRLARAAAALDRRDIDRQVSLSKWVEALILKQLGRKRYQDRDKTAA